MSPSPASQTNVSRALDQLRELIFSGALAPGSNHLESELALRLGMSRTPIREAAMVLEQQGLVTVQPRKGIRILPVSVEDMAEIYDVLTVLEAQAAADAARRGGREADIAPLHTAIDAMDAALAAGDLIAWAAADDAFHAALVALGGNRRLAAITAQMADQVRRARRATLFLWPMPHQSNADHRAVVEAIAAGEADRAAELHRAHRIAAKEMLIALLQRHQLQQL